ncbi:MAG: formate--tetrahydrofolate ligase, partial [Oscillospiraceae bacterium]
QKNTAPRINFAYELNDNIKTKLENVCKKIYGAKDVIYTAEAEKAIAQIEAQNIPNLAVCNAKTQYSFSDDATKLAAPKDFTVTVRNVRLSAGAGFAVAIMGNIMTMPGLPKKPAALNIDVDENGEIKGLF